MQEEIIKGIKVRYKNAEKTLQKLKKTNFLNEKYKIRKENNIIFFPIKNCEKEKIFTYKILLREFEKKKIYPKSYKEILSLSEEKANLLPSSYDVIGNIVLIKLPDELLRNKKDIANAILKIHENIETVCLCKPVSGEFRTRDIEIIGGRKSTVTTHKEYGLHFLLDVNKTYFSPRLANERRRISSLVGSGEVIVDMFTGVAPFSIMIAKYADPKIVISIDKNKDAVFYAKENIKINKMLDKVEVFFDDAKNAAKILNTKNIQADRVIMNLPFSSHLFFPFVFNLFSERCFIHYYDILKEDEFEKKIAFLKCIAKKKDFVLSDVIINRIKTYAPREFYIGIDITAKKKK